MENSKILAENDMIFLAQPSENELDQYVQVMKENSKNRDGFDDLAYKEHLWQELNRETGFFCSILRKSDGAFCGYCGIEDMEEEQWEISVELLKQYHRQGLGFQSLDLLMHMLKETKGVSVFKSRVEGLNLASQKLMEKAYGSLVGIEQEDGLQVLVYQHRI